MTIEKFIANPNQKNWEESGISGDINMMRELYQKSKELAKKFFSCQDWIEMCEFEKSFSVRNIFLGNAVHNISSFQECIEVFNLDKQFKFFRQLWKKFANFAVSFEEKLFTICTFEEYKKTSLGRKILQDMIDLAETDENIEALMGLVSLDDKVLSDNLTKKSFEISSLS